MYVNLKNFFSRVSIANHKTKHLVLLSNFNYPNALINMDKYLSTAQLVTALSPKQLEHNQCNEEPKNLVEPNILFVDDPKPHLVDLKLTENLRFGEAKKQKFGGVKVQKFVEIEGKVKPFQLQLRGLRSEFGLRSFPNDNGKPPNKVMEFGFGSYYNFFRENDVINSAILQYRVKQWAPGTAKWTASELRKLHNPVTRFRQTQKDVMSPVLTTKLWNESGVFDYNGEPIQATSETLVADTYYNMLIESTGLWIGEKGFSEGWKVVNLKQVTPPAVGTTADPVVVKSCKMVD